MDFRRIASLCLLSIFFGSAAFAQGTPGTSYLFQLPGTGGGTVTKAFLAETADLNADFETLSGPAGGYEILPVPDGSRIYIVGANSIQYIDPGLQGLLALGIAGPIQRAVLTPDGKYLLVSADNFYIINTGTNAVVSTNLGVSGNLIDFTVSPDSRRAYLLQRFSISGALTSIDLTNLTVIKRSDISRPGASIAYSPQGKLYIPSQNLIAEYDPVTFDLLNETQMSATPGRLHFNLAGTVAYFTDSEPTQGYGIVAYRVASHDIVAWPANVFEAGRPILDEIYIANNDTIFGLQRSTHTLWQISTNPLSGAPANFQAFPSDTVFAAALSKEIPSARFLYVLTENSGRPVMERISLATGNLEVISNAQSNEGVLRYAILPPQTGAAQIIKFNDNQSVPQGGQARPLVAYVTDNLGRPVFNQTVTFSADPLSGVTFSNSSAHTNANGYVETTATVPQVPGTYIINLNAGSAAASFTILVPSTGGPGDPDPGGPSPRFIITRGNGQLLRERGGNAPQFLTVKALTEAGEPMEGVSVQFSLVGGTGAVFPAEALTDAGGFASAQFIAGEIPGFVAPYLNSTVRATSFLGSVDFIETVFRMNPDQLSGIPLSTPPTSYDVEVARGEVTENIFSTRILTASFLSQGQPIPGVGLRISPAESARWSEEGPGACVNDTLSNNDGLARCDFKATCDLSSSPTQVAVHIGEMLVENIRLAGVPGTSRTIQLLGGNNQTANLGTLLPERLSASIADNCGNPVVGQGVTWTVSQGSATLDQVIAVSDASGFVSARVRMGQIPGPVQIRVAISEASSVTFTLTGTASVASLQLTSGGSQTALIGTQFANPVVFTVRDNTGNPIQGVVVNLAATGSATIPAVQGTTDATGQVQTTVTAGPNPGNVTVTASYASFSATANLTVRPPTLPLTSAAFSNAASGANGLVPCGLAMVVGNGLVPTPGVLSGISAFGPLNYSLGSVQSLTVNGVPAPIQAVSNQDGKQQVNFQVPCETQPGNATVVIRVGGVDTTVSGVPVFVGQPGIFTFAGPGGKIYGAVLSATTGQYVQPGVPARTGERYYLILTGLGQATPAINTNSAGADQVVNLTAQVGVANAGVPTQPARYLRGSIGVYYVEFTIDKHPTAAPNTVLLTDTPLAVFLSINGQPVFSQPGVLLPSVVQGN